MPTPVHIRFTDADLDDLCAAGRARQRFAEKDNLKSRYNRGDDSRLCEGDHIVGVIGEKASSLAVGVGWSATVGMLDAYDLPGNIECRARRIPGVGPDLVLLPHDKPKIEAPFVLAHVHGAGHDTYVMGWIICRDGMKRKYHRMYKRYEPKGACFVKPSDLRDISELRAWLEARGHRHG